MYENIGSKIKGLAIAVAVLETIAAVIVGFIFIGRLDNPVGLVYMFVGPVIAWISSWLLYGFGELICKTSDIYDVAVSIRYIMYRSNDSQDAFDTNHRAQKLKKLRNQGLITEEEYQQAIAKN